MKCNEKRLRKTKSWCATTSLSKLRRCCLFKKRGRQLKKGSRQLKDVIRMIWLKSMDLGLESIVPRSSRDQLARLCSRLRIKEYKN